MKKSSFVLAAVACASSLLFLLSACSQPTDEVSATASPAPASSAGAQAASSSSQAETLFSGNSTPTGQEPAAELMRWLTKTDCQRFFGASSISPEDALLIANTVWSAAPKNEQAQSNLKKADSTAVDQVVNNLFGLREIRDYSGIPTRVKATDPFLQNSDGTLACQALPVSNTDSFVVTDSHEEDGIYSVCVTRYAGTTPAPDAEVIQIVEWKYTLQDDGSIRIIDALLA